MKEALLALQLVLVIVLVARISRLERKLKKEGKERDDLVATWKWTGMAAAQNNDNDFVPPLHQPAAKAFYEGWNEAAPRYGRPLKGL